MTYVKPIFNLKKVQEALSDIAKISRIEIQRGVKEAKKQVNKYQILQRRKELFTELGQTFYELTQENNGIEMIALLQNSEISDIISDIHHLDQLLIDLEEKEENA